MAENTFLGEPCVSNDVKKDRSKFGLLLFGVTSACTVALCSVVMPFVSPALRKICLPYVPATSTQVQNVLRALNSFKAGKSLVDIGSGDGRIVIETAKAGYKSVGYELNPWLVLYSKIQSRKHAISSQATFKRCDLWNKKYNQFDNVVIFGVDQMMPRLEKKLLSELKPGSKVIACRFPLPNYPVYQVFGSGVDTVWSYIVSDERF